MFKVLGSILFSKKEKVKINLSLINLSTHSIKILHLGKRKGENPFMLESIK